MRGLVVVMAVALLATPIAAHHPGSVTEVPVDGLVHRHIDVLQSFQAWEGEYPEFVETFSIGTSVGGLELYGIKITGESVAFDAAATPEKTKYRIYLDGGHHGNEYMGVELIMYYLAQQLQLIGDGDQATLDFYQTHELHAVPMINPEGNTLDTRKNGRQVDVNRNYEFQWGGDGSSGLIASPTYRGPAAMSEPEVVANADYAKQIRPDLWITMHSGVAEFYWPWGWTTEKSPDHEMFERIEAPFESATNGAVDAMMAANLYVASGATDDYGYGALGIPTFTYEVHNDQFYPAYTEPIDGILVDQLAGLDFMVQNTKHLGARLIATNTEGGLEIQNIGWGTATDIVVRVGGEQIIVADLPSNQATTVNVAGQGTAEISYDYLYIDSNPLRVITVPLGGSAGEPDDVAASAPLLGLSLLLAAVLVNRRR